MNKQRRTALLAQLSVLQKIRDEFAPVIAALRSDFSAMHDEVDTVLGEEQDAFDNMPEGLQNGDKGNAMQEGIGALEESLDIAENFGDELETWFDEQCDELKTKLEEAMGGG